MSRRLHAIVLAIAILALGAPPTLRIARAGERAAPWATSSDAASASAAASAAIPCPSSGGPACAISMTDLAMTNATEGWVVGDDGFIARFDSGALTPVESPTTERIEAVAAVSADEAWAVGRGIFHYADGAWSVALPGEDVALLDVDFFSPDAGWAVGRPQRAYRYQAGNWELFDLPTGGAIAAVDVISADEAWVVDNDGVVLRFAEGAWQVDAELPCRPHCRPADIAMVSPTEGWVVGLDTNAGQISAPIPDLVYRAPMLYRRGPDGWRLAEVPELARESGITALAMANGEGWAATDTGGLLRFEGDAWSWWHAPFGPSPAAIALGGAGLGWAVGELGSVLRLEAGCWRRAGGPPLVPDALAGPAPAPGEFAEPFRALVWRAFIPFATGKPDGPVLVRLTDDPVNEWQPALAPDGLTLAYVAVAGGRHNALMVRDACGNAHATSRPSDYHNEMREEVPSFDGEGRTIVHGFIHRLDGRDHARLARVAPDGSGLVELKATAGDIGHGPRRPSLSPDGVWLAYDADAGVPDGPDIGSEINREIYVLELATGEARRLTDHPAHDKLPVFAADNQTLYFRSERDGNSEIYRINVDGGDLTRITDHPSLDTWPSPSSDGRTLVFQSDRTPGEGIYALDLDSGVTTRLTSPSYRALTPRVAPDGASVIFAADVHGQFDVFRLALP